MLVSDIDALMYNLNRLFHVQIYFIQAYAMVINFHPRFHILATSTLLWNKQGNKYLWIMFPSTTDFCHGTLQIKFSSHSKPTSQLPWKIITELLYIEFLPN